MTVERYGKKLIRSGSSFYHWCPACNEVHMFESPRWTFNMDAEKPDVKPSLLRSATHKDGTRETECHYFIDYGKISFCSDCPHSFAGKTVDLPDFPAGYHFGDDFTS